MNFLVVQNDQNTENGRKGLSYKISFFAPPVKIL